MITDDDIWPLHMSRKKAAAYLTLHGFPISVSTLAKMACFETAVSGPPHFRTSWGRVNYPKVDLDIWAKNNIKRIK